MAHVPQHAESSGPFALVEGGFGRDPEPRPAKVTRPSHWPALVASAVLEAVWAIALSESQGFTILIPTLVFVVGCLLSMIGLAHAMRGIPVSVAYAVWTGTGAALTVTTAMVMGSEPVSVMKLVFLAGIVGCVIGLKFAKSPEVRDEPRSSRG